MCEHGYVYTIKSYFLFNIINYVIFILLKHMLCLNELCFVLNCVYIHCIYSDHTQISDIFHARHDRGSSNRQNIANFTYCIV